MYDLIHSSNAYIQNCANITPSKKSESYIGQWCFIILSICVFKLMFHIYIIVIIYCKLYGKGHYGLATKTERSYQLKIWIVTHLNHLHVQEVTRPRQKKRLQSQWLLRVLSVNLPQPAKPVYSNVCGVTLWGDTEKVKCWSGISTLI